MNVLNFELMHQEVFAFTQFIQIQFDDLQGI